jgi:hypothetical protein
MMVLRIFLCGGFLYGARRSMASMVPDSPQTRVLQHTMVLGGAYFLALPLLVLVAAVLPQSWRHVVVRFGSVSVQAVALAVMLLNFVVRGSTFFKASTLSRVGEMLPSVGHSRAKKVAVD